MYQQYKNFPLKNLNTLAIPATAQHLIVIQHTDAIPHVLKKLRHLPTPLVLGSGSNVLLRQTILKRPVLICNFQKIKVVYEDATCVHVQVDAGVSWHYLVTWAVQHGWGGLENLALIPGTVGAAPVQNIGAYGAELSDVCLFVHTYCLESGQSIAMSREECQFSYRDSCFKKTLKNKRLIDSVTLKLTKHPKAHLNTRYLDALEAPTERSTSLESVYKAVIALRQKKLPDPKQLPNAGSFFKNPVITSEQYQQLKGNYHPIPGYKQSTQDIKVPAAWLIEQCGWKGYRKKDVGVHCQQALVLVHHWHARTGEQDICKALQQLAQTIQASVQDKFGIELKQEVTQPLDL